MNWLEELKPGDRVLVRNRCQPHKLKKILEIVEE